jgi:hypothetical protein
MVSLQEIVCAAPNAVFLRAETDVGGNAYLR